ncbi:hypothetical protein [Streptomyces sp. NBRC 110465]|uniref:hypothetical protein n=1 Tax=Streptomyces sp. NBRC 110465 TaxID=1897621 RepID=UPI0009344B3B|nr:hypothetical protein [Streptomyces sp. NBRC 110465]
MTSHRAEGPIVQLHVVVTERTAREPEPVHLHPFDLIAAILLAHYGPDTGPDAPEPQGGPRCRHTTWAPLSEADVHGFLVDLG